MLGYYPSPRAGAGLSIVYNKFGLEDEFHVEGVDVDLSILEVTLHARVSMGDFEVAQPYIHGLAGLFRNTISATPAGGETTSVSDNAFGIGGGVGMMLPGDNPLRGFVEGVAFADFTEGDPTYYLGVRAGLMVFWSIAGQHR